MSKTLLKVTRGSLIFVVAFLSSSAWSQTSKDESEKDEKRGVRFVCTEIAPGTPETLKLLGKGGVKDVPLNTRAPGDLFTIPPDGEILLGLESGDPEKPITPLALGKVPEGMTRATALLISRPKQPDETRYHLFIIDDGNLKGGSVYFLNLCKSECLAKLDDKQISLVPGKPVIFQPTDLVEGRNSPVAIVVETNEDGAKEWRPLLSSTWRLRPTRIEICVVYWNEEYGRPSIKGLTLFPMSNEPLKE